mmetsp:Transcript_88611/g.231294  ORF Transcript_88611/g.231294 Transcript_88611/m.231294 type:complete len:106 (-) Transcript_88611:6-323(-)
MEAPLLGRRRTPATPTAKAAADAVSAPRAIRAAPALEGLGAVATAAPESGTPAARCRTVGGRELGNAACSTKALVGATARAAPATNAIEDARPKRRAIAPQGCFL